MVACVYECVVSYLIVMYVRFGVLLLLCHAIRNPSMWGFRHVESKCGHVFMASLGHTVHFGFGCKLGHKIILRWLPIYGHIGILEFV